MGADIHGPFVEVELGPDLWSCEAELRWARDYTAFGLIAGVRSDGTGIDPIIPPRGVPADMSMGYRFHVEVDGGGCHSHSWLTIDELAEVIAAYPSEDGPAFHLRLGARLMRETATEALHLTEWAHAHWVETKDKVGSLNHPEPVMFVPRVRIAFCFDN